MGSIGKRCEGINIWLVSKVPLKVLGCLYSKTSTAKDASLNGVDVTFL